MWGCERGRPSPDVPRKQLEKRRSQRQQPAHVGQHRRHRRVLALPAKHGVFERHFVGVQRKTAQLLVKKKTLNCYL